VLQHLKERRQDEKGFTLIELMVVVLIMGILMAIAIPTFLSTRGSANDSSAKSNVTNVFTNEKSYYASNQQFLTAQATDTGNTLDDTLPWGTGVGFVQAVAVNGTAPTAAVVILDQSSSGNCFYQEDSETGNSAVIGFAEMTGGSTANTCPDTAAFTPITAVTAGSAAGHTIAFSSTAAPTTYYSTW
jgi:type IV pilus assembly protein PilA